MLRPMRAVELIAKKRDGGTHTRAEIEFLVNGYVAGQIPDYQVAAWLMAVCLVGMTGDETGALTGAMIDSGATIDLSSLAGPLVDKHSTGGVGDKVSLILAPLAAACGVQVPMMSGRALGHTGGTLDKLESIAGYSTALSAERFRLIIDECGYAMTGQSAEIVPADRLLYALRDVTATVESIPLITASIMSKKFAEGADALVFDVKTGRGAFMKEIDDSRSLAQSLIDTGRSLGRGVVTVITRMDEPLGRMIGNFLEVEESMRCLRGSAPTDGLSDDLIGVTIRLTAWMLVAAGVESAIEDAEAVCRARLADGSAYERFMRNVELQGGDPAELERQIGSRRAAHAVTIDAVRGGYVTAIDAYAFGLAGVGLGVGRNKTSDEVRPDVGFELHAKQGDRVAAGQPLYTIHADSADAASDAAHRLVDAYAIDDTAIAAKAPVVEEHAAL